MQIEAQGYRARKRRHKDVDARWTKKHGVSEYGYKNHVSVDRAHGLVGRYEVADAARHDSQVFEQLLDETNASADVWADSAYRSKEHEQMLAKAGYRSRIHRKAQRNRPLSARSLNANRKRSRVRARVEHVFAHQEGMGRKLVRTVGLHRARVKVGMMNLVYNLRRFGWLLTAHTPPGSCLSTETDSETACTGVNYPAETTAPRPIREPPTVSNHSTDQLIAARQTKPIARGSQVPIERRPNRGCISLGESLGQYKA